MNIQAPGGRASMNCIILPWIEKLRSSCQIAVEGFERKVMWILMTFSYGSAKFCCNVPSINHWGCDMEITEWLIQFLGFFVPFFLCPLTLSLKFFICFQFFFQQLGWLFIHFFSAVDIPVTKHVVSCVYAQNPQHGLLAQNEISCILATELMNSESTLTSLWQITLYGFYLALWF